MVFVLFLPLAQRTTRGPVSTTTCFVVSSGAVPFSLKFALKANDQPARRKEPSHALSPATKRMTLRRQSACEGGRPGVFGFDARCWSR